MSYNLSRMTAYALLSSLEIDLRNLIKGHVVNQENLSVDDGLLEKAMSRSEKDVGIIHGKDSEIDLIDYFDLGDTYQFINSNRTIFPQNIADHIKKQTPKLQKIVVLRNRVMHIRPLNYNDLPAIIDFCKEIVSQEPLIWGSVIDTLNKIEENPSYVLSLEIKDPDESESISHNLPLPDFDETGLIGRDDISKQLKKLCLGAFPVISLVGEGGIGKSALALKVAYELLEEKKPPFDAIVWVSSKTTQITVNEIKDIKGAINSSLGVINEISSVLGGDSNAEPIDEIIEYLTTFKIALFIDNLETIVDDNIKSLVSALPNGSKIIITSRIGLGAFEYPIKLQGIEEHYASQLLRTLSKNRNVNTISSMPEATLIKYVHRMHLNPGYIKWFVSALQTGLQPERVLQNSDVFLNFCMSNVYEYLSDEATEVTMALLCAPGWKDIAELAYLINYEAIKIQRAIQELMSTNMLVEKYAQVGSSMKITYQLAELPREYLKKYHKPTKNFQLKIQENRNKLTSMFEQQLANRTSHKYSTLNIKIREKSDRVVAKKLYDVLCSIRAGNYDGVYEELIECQKLAPEYFEVPRVLAYFHMKNGNIPDARDNFELAITLEPEKSQLHYWFAKFLIRHEEQTDLAVEHFEKAHKLDPTSADVGVALARGYLFQKQFPECYDMLNSLESEIETYSEQLQKIFYDTKVQLYYREADEYSIHGDEPKAIESLFLMKEEFESLDDKFKDFYSRNKLLKAKYIINRLLKGASIIDYDKNRLGELEKWIGESSKI
ncbi:NB-ARC domain-containing protein [Lonsdalea quercina]|uniref:NB-ARC domain-containing protein n=1 Tax=Lonsdalea quercina TaxID=71657 RepID=UPI0039766802